MPGSEDASRPNDMFEFRLLQSAGAKLGPRLGQLALKRGVKIDTPHYVGITSRGVIPHLSQDTLAKHTNLKGVYVALEDFVEKAPQKVPPILTQSKHDKASALHEFLGVNDDKLVILGARRSPPVTCPGSNTQTSISVSTSVGFQQLPSEDYAYAVQKLRPDIVVGLGDISYGETPGWRRTEKMSGRTEKWMKDLIDTRHEREDDCGDSTIAPIFAPILPISTEQQYLYLDLLTDDWASLISGLTIYDAEVLAELAQPMSLLPRLGLTEPSTPQRILREISLGVDVFTIPFVSAATDAGIALDFTFPVLNQSSNINDKKSLGLDMWGMEHVADVSAIVDGCTCYACKKHHRAYIQHLLSAKEMLAWVLLQTHNLHMMDQFFIGVRESIRHGRFEDDCGAFEGMYDSKMPDKTGQGPRVRGYQFKTEGPGEAKKNPLAYRMLNDGKNQIEEVPAIPSDATAATLEQQGFAVPTESSRK